MPDPLDLAHHHGELLRAALDTATDAAALVMLAVDPRQPVASAHGKACTAIRRSAARLRTDISLLLAELAGHGQPADLS